MSEPVFMVGGDDPQMEQASLAARRTFKFFWRELSWERRRIVPGLDMAIIKLRFTDGPRSDGKPEYEQMWVGEVDFDGSVVKGKLVNAPNWLRSVKQGDSIRVPAKLLVDWMMVAEGVPYGGYTVDLMRSRMNPKERNAHDRAWGLKFAEPNNVRVEINREKRPGGMLS